MCPQYGAGQQKTLALERDFGDNPNALLSHRRRRNPPKPPPLVDLERNLFRLRFFLPQPLI
jgi:hypothetical protein